jgi:uncharacterized membrane protein HdeD (DUF308 family)
VKIILLHWNACYTGETPTAVAWAYCYHSKTILCITLLAAFLIFNSVNCIDSSPNKQRKTGSTIVVNKNKLKVIRDLLSFFDPTTEITYLPLQ